MSKIKEHLESVIEEYIGDIAWNQDENKIRELTDPNCRHCGGGGVMQGDWVPYGSTSVRTPPVMCECLWEHGSAIVQDKLVRGELEEVAGKDWTISSHECEDCMGDGWLWRQVYPESEPEREECPTCDSMGWELHIKANKKEDKS